MALTPGTRLGAYEIIALIGAGGMGEVYRARDTRLNRDVALKVLPELFAADPDRLARFKREAQLLASLNHPNIAAIYGFEESTDVGAGFNRLGGTLVLELVDGPTLADRIAQGPIPLDEALPIARQIAEALEVAHEHGVIHRDLKPANIKVRPDGTVKVLDFGLAKAFEGEASTPDVSQSPTLSVAGTHMGLILGTAAYMAPEQAKGRSVDKRADIWAFGCVLYEMLTGRQAFEGDDVSEILASVIKGTANLDLLPADIHPGVRRVIRRCLEKDVRKRCRDIGDVRNELEEIQANPRGVELPSEAHASWRRTLRQVAVVVVAAGIAATAGWMLKPSAAVQPGPVTRFVQALPDGHVFRNTGRSMIAISPDGRHFLYNTTGGLFLRSMDGLTARVIPGTEDSVTNPFFSPDGQWVAYFEDNQLKKISIAGGTPVVLAKATNLFGANWGADGTILFGQPEGIKRVSADGGTPELVVRATEGEQVHGPQMLPGGEWLLYSLARGAAPNRWDTADIVAHSIRSGERKVLWKGGSDALYVATGHLIYALDDALFSLPFDLQRLEPAGGPVPVLSGLQRALNPGTNTATAQYSVSDNGTLVHIVGGSSAFPTRTPAWIDRNGREELIPAPPRAYLYPRISPDGSQVAFDVRDQDFDIWIWSLPRRTLTRLTFDRNVDRSPVWMPDGRRIVFASQSAADFSNLFWQAADGTSAAERLVDSKRIQTPSSVSADGRTLFFEELTASSDVYALSLDGERKARALIATMFAERNAELSPDGRWLAYQSTESGRNEVYVRPFPDIEQGRWQVSAGGGRQPLWASNSRELFFVDPESRIVAVPVQPGPSFSAGDARVVVDTPVVPEQPGFSGRNYDVSRDGRRFLIVKDSVNDDRPSAPSPIGVVQNWFEELKRLAPTN